MIKSYNDLLKENAFSTTEMLEDIYDTYCTSANDDVMSSNIQNVPVQIVSPPDMFIYSKDEFFLLK